MTNCRNSSKSWQTIPDVRQPASIFGLLGERAVFAGMHPSPWRQWKPSMCLRLVRNSGSRSRQDRCGLTRCGFAPRDGHRPFRHCCRRRYNLMDRYRRRNPHQNPSFSNSSCSSLLRSFHCFGVVCCLSGVTARLSAIFAKECLAGPVPRPLWFALARSLQGESGRGVRPREYARIKDARTR